jgi:hypothetical protein
MRILLSEGSSTSARQAITILGLDGHHIEVCDPDAHCIGRFSRFVRRFHRCPGLAADPAGYISFILKLVSNHRFDVLLPIHEQGLALAKVRDALAPHVAIALPTYTAYHQALSKVGFSRLLADLGLPQPQTRFIKTREEALALVGFPLALKSAIGTASRTVWQVRDPDSLKRAVDQLERQHAFIDLVLAQNWIEGVVEHAQAVFDRGQLLGMHAYRQVVRGAGGGDAAKESVLRPLVRDHLARIGRHLDWHGALSVDYLASDKAAEIHYIDCNPRLVEPMNALLAGHDLLTALLEVTAGRSPPPLAPGRAGVRSHMALQALLGCAMRTTSRCALLRECWRLVARRGIYRNSQEELTSLRGDWPSVVPTLVAAAWLLVRPTAAERMSRAGWGAHLLTPESVRIIGSWNSRHR